MASLQEARIAKAKVREMLAGVAEVRGIGIANMADGYGVKVNLSRIPSHFRILDEVDGVPIVIDLVGEIRAT